MAKMGRPPYPPARPSRMLDVHRYNDDGTPEAVWEAIIRYIRAGYWLETACAMVNVNTGVVRGWLRDGAAAYERRITGASRKNLSAHHRRCEVFALQVRAAMAEQEAGLVDLIGLVARGGIPQVKTVRRTTFVREADGTETDRQLVEETVTATRTLPNVRALIWMLQNRFPQHWAPAERSDELDVGAQVDADADVDPVEELDDLLNGINRRRAETAGALERAGIREDVIDVAAVPRFDDAPAPDDDSPL